MAFFEKYRTALQKSLAETIKYDGPNDAIIWKFPKMNFCMNAQLIVGPSQEAFFVDGSKVIGHFTTGSYSLSMENYPFIPKVRIPIRFLTCNVYYINKGVSIGFDWHMDPSLVISDPANNVPVEICSYGDISLSIENGQMMLEKMKWEWRVDTGDLKFRFKERLNRQIRGVIAENIMSHKLSLTGINASRPELSKLVKERVSPIFEPYGLAVDHFSISNISVMHIERRMKAQSIPMPDMEMESTGEDTCKISGCNMSEQNRAGGTNSKSSATYAERAGGTNSNSSVTDTERTGRTNSNSSVAYTVGTERTNEERAVSPALDDVRFTAMADRKIRSGDLRILEISMYRPEWEEIILKEMENEIGTETQSYSSGWMKIAKGTHVTVCLSAAGIKIEEDTDMQTWNNKYLKFVFDYEVPEDYGKNQILFRAKIYFDGVIATTLRFIVHVEEGKQIPEVQREDVHSGFVSYSRKDIQPVTYIVQALKTARPDMDIFFDLTKLRSGEYWENRLMKEIEKREVLFLCWSVNASKSEWVEREWKTMLDLKGLNAIEPIPLDDPQLCPVPQDLKPLHFDDMELLIRSARRFADAKIIP